MEKLPVVKRGEAKSAAKDPSKKLASKKEGPYWELRVQENTLIVGTSGIHSFISIERVTFAMIHQEAEVETENPQGEQYDDKAELEGRPALKNKDATHPQKYAVEKYVADRQPDGIAQYRVWWYIYAPEKETWKLSEHITWHLIKWYRERQWQANEHRNSTGSS